MATALTTQVTNSAVVTAGQSAYFGARVEADKRGRVILADVAAESPAEKAGVQPGDVLLKIAGRSLKSVSDFQEILRQRHPGEALPVRLERGRKSMDLTVTLGALSRPLQIRPQRATLGVRLEAPPQGEGALITNITANSAAARAGLKAGDILITVDGDPVRSPDFVREVLDEKGPGDKIKLGLVRDGAEMELEPTLTAQAAEPSGGRSPRSNWRKPAYRLAVVLVEYPDVSHNERIATNAWDDFWFSTDRYRETTNITGQRVHGSVRDYYHENSAGRFRLEGRVFDWVPLKGKRMEYAQGTNMFNKTPFITEALDRLREREGDEVLDDFDGLIFIHAGERVRTANRGSLYWPHKGVSRYRGKSWSYVICPEGGRTMANISVFVHEFGHMLGLPDLYARPENPGSEGLGDWCVMSNERGNGQPQHFSAWSKEALGWLQPAVLDPTVPQKLLLGPIEGSTNECFKVLVRRDGSEYFLLENRRRVGFDKSLAGEGLLIWRVVGGRPILEESHGVEGAPGPRVFKNSVPYPSRANNAFTPYSIPSSRSLLGGGLPVHITNIRKLPDGRIAFVLGYEFQ